MMLLAIAPLLLSLEGQAYLRTKTSDSDPNAFCLYWREGTTITWKANAQGNPETTGETEFTAFQRAIATWQNEMTGCGSLTFTEGARSSSRSIGYDDRSADNENVFIFRQKRCDDPGVALSMEDACWKDDTCGNKYDCWNYSSGALAITTTSFNPKSGFIFDSDVELNTPGYIFTTVDGPQCLLKMYSQSCVVTDVQNTMTHEIGHLLGLAHTNAAGSVMNPTAQPGELSKRTLDTGTKDFVCKTYPKGKPANSCPKVASNGDLLIPAVKADTGPGVVGCTAAPAGLAVLGLIALLRRRRR